MNLARQGYAEHRELDRRENAFWMQLVLTALTGEKITQAQLLGEEAAEQAAKGAQAERDLADLDERRKAAGLGAGGMIPVHSTGEVFMG